MSLALPQEAYAASPGGSAMRNEGDGMHQTTTASDGEAVLRAAKPCGRCEVTTTDQASGEVRGPEPLATLATFRDSSEFGLMFGLNLVTAQGGLVRVGEAVTVS